MQVDSIEYNYYQLSAKSVCQSKSLNALQADSSSSYLQLQHVFSNLVSEIGKIGH